MTPMEFIKKTVLPVAVCLLVVALVYPHCVENGSCDYLKLWLFTGIPFGVQRMFVWIIPRGFDIGGTVGVLVMNLLIGGVIGGFILIWRLTVAVFYLVRGVFAGIGWLSGKCFAR